MIETRPVAVSSVWAGALAFALHAIVLLTLVFASAEAHRALLHHAALPVDVDVIESAPPPSSPDVFLPQPQPPAHHAMAAAMPVPAPARALPVASPILTESERAPEKGGDKIPFSDDASDDSGGKGSGRDKRAGAEIDGRFTPTPPSPIATFRTPPSAPPPVSTVDRSRAAALVRTGEWSCPWPNEAELEQIDEAVVIITAVVEVTGRASRVDIVNDPGHGFGREARRCALRETWTPALDRDGHPARATTKAIRVHFAR